jgi:hypothetical protein
MSRSNSNISFTEWWCDKFGTVEGENELKEFEEKATEAQYNEYQRWYEKRYIQ